MTKYPETLPCPNLAGNSMQGGDTFTRSIFDHSIRQRKSYCADYGAAFSFTTNSAAQMVLFREFYYNTLNNGTSSFTAEWEIEGDTTEKQFRFSSVYKSASLGKGIYRITANFEMQTKIKDL